MDNLLKSSLPMTDMWCGGNAMVMGALLAYQEEEIISADPIALVRLLYRGAIEAVETARQRLAARDIRGRSDAISKAVEILGELMASLNHEGAPDVSRRLAELYDYMQRRLLTAHFEQADAPLAEVRNLLQSLAEAWNRMPASESCAPAPSPAPMTHEWNAQAPEPAAQGWSF
jgi:flagellar protein FliS